jgi:hypothetical protein
VSCHVQGVAETQPLSRQSTRTWLHLSVHEHCCLGPAGRLLSQYAAACSACVVLAGQVAGLQSMNCVDCLIISELI